MTRFGADPVARDTLPVHVLLFVRADPDAGAVVLQQVLGAILDASRPVGVLALGVLLPRIFHWVVSGIDRNAFYTSLRVDLGFKGQFLVIYLCMGGHSCLQTPSS